jgi:predicted CoA-substrate-specific enzyme activase
MITVGIDIGSMTRKIAVLDQAHIVVQQTTSAQTEAMDFARQGLTAVALRPEDVDAFVATGRGRAGAGDGFHKKSIPLCLAKGAHRLFPEKKAVIDIGAESATVVVIGDKGWPLEFIHNDVCAAGTGLFLDTVAKALQMPLAEMAAALTRAAGTAPISSTCVVFAESEIVSLIHSGTPKEAIIAGVNRAIAQRIAGMWCKVGCPRGIVLSGGLACVGLADDLVITGGIAKNQGVVQRLEQRLGITAKLPPEPQIIGALGAALIAWERIETGVTKTVGADNQNRSTERSGLP